MRLSDFIRAELEPILQDWEDFADTIFKSDDMDKAALRDHAKEMLLEIADDLESEQNEAEQAAKSKGRKQDNGEESWAEIHGSDRQSSGFSVIETVSEFRALRASVISHWTKASTSKSLEIPEDLTRFHEAIDQAVAESMKQYANVKEKETRLFGAILLASPDPIFVLDLQTRFIYANKTTADLFALEFEDIIGKTIFDLGFPFAEEFQHNILKVNREQTPYQGKFIHTFNADQGDRFEYRLAPVLDDQKKTESTVCILRDITEQALAEEKIWHNAHHDQLTGLPNRRLFLDRLDQEVKHVKRTGLPPAVLFMDLDGFKEVNDSLGHDAGDRVLQIVAERLLDCVREEDTVARLGGDEFTVILSGAQHQENVEGVAQTIINAIDVPFQLGQKQVQISVSIGVSLFLDNEMSSNEMVEAADHAMYKAKKSRSKRIFFYDAFNTDIREGD